MVMGGGSVHLTSLFSLGKLEQAVNQYFVHILSLVTDNIREDNDRRNNHNQSSRKYGTGPGSNSQPLDLQSDSHLLPDMLPTALRGPVPSNAAFNQGLHCFLRQN